MELIGEGQTRLAGALLTCQETDADGRCVKYLQTCEWPGECLTESPAHPDVPGREKRKKKAALVLETERQPKAPPPKTAPPKRVRFHRGHLDSAINAARRLKHGEDVFIFGTQRGYVIEYKPPPFRQGFVVVHPDGTTETYEHDPKRGEVVKLEKKAAAPAKPKTQRPKPATSRKPRAKPAKLKDYYFWIPKGGRKPRQLKSLGQGLSRQGQPLKEVLDAAAAGEGKLYEVAGADNEDALQRLEEGRRAEKKGQRVYETPHSEWGKPGVLRINPYSAERAAKFPPEPKTAVAHDLESAFEQGKRKAMKKEKTTVSKVLASGVAHALAKAGVMDITTQKVEDAFDGAFDGIDATKVGAVTLQSLIAPLENDLKDQAYVTEHNGRAEKLRGIAEIGHDLQKKIFGWSQLENLDERVRREARIELRNEHPNIIPGSEAYQEMEDQYLRDNRGSRKENSRQAAYKHLQHWEANQGAQIKDDVDIVWRSSMNLLDNARLLEKLKPGSKVVERCQQIGRKVHDFASTAKDKMKDEKAETNRAIDAFQGIGMAGLGGALLTCSKWKVIGLPGAEAIRCEEYAQTCKPGDKDCVPWEKPKRKKQAKKTRGAATVKKAKPEPEPPAVVELDPVELRILKAVEYVFPQKIHIDEIQRRTGMAASKISSGLVMLELKGMVQQSAGKMFVAKRGLTLGQQRKREAQIQGRAT